MATWKKVIVSGSRAHLTDVTASAYLAPANTTGFIGTASYALAAGAAGAAPFFTISASNSNGGTLFGASTDTLFFAGSNGLTASFTDNGSITTASFGIGTAAQVTFGGVTASLSGTATNSDKILTVQDGTSATRYLTFVDSDNTAPGAYESLYTDAGITYNPSTNNLTITGDLAVNGGDITSTTSPFNIATAATAVAIGATTNGSTVTVGDLAVNGATSADITTTNTIATVFNTTATNVSAFGAATTLTIGNNGTNAAITIGSNTSTVSFGNNVVIAGNLDINGTLTTIDTTNLLVADRFILLASGSNSPVDGGIIVQSATGGSGFAYFLDNSATPRWGFTSSLSSTDNSTNFSALEYAVSALSGAADPTNAPTYGGATLGHGNIYVNGAGDIFIYS